MSETEIEEPLTKIEEGDTPEGETPEPPDPDEPEADADLEVDEQPEPPSRPLSDKELEQAFKKLEGEQNRHNKRLSEIMGDDFSTMLVCELCEPTIAGYRFNTPLSEEQRQMVAVAIGLAGDAAIKEDDEAVKCDRCDGMGVTRTGSKVPGAETRACTKCAAKGWTSASDRNTWDSTHQAAQVAVELREAGTITPEEPRTLPATDAWGRPQGSPFYGMNPAYMTPAQLASDDYRAAA